MSRFEDYFSDESIIRELCKARVLLAKKRNEALFLHRISKDRPAPDRPKPSSPDAVPLDIFPPRRRWHSFRPANRGERDSLCLNQQALYCAVLALRRRTSHAPWVQKLEQRVAVIRHRALSTSSFRFNPPRVFAGEKDHRKHEYRPLAVFALDDKIIEGLTARYLREAFDGALRESCLAFRCAQPRQAPPTVRAVHRLVCINRRHRKTGVFVAECDIKGFFDCVSHDVARSALRELIADARKRDRTVGIDRRALEIFDAYVDVYSFSRDVELGKVSATLRKSDPQGKFKWPREELERLHGTRDLAGIGVPQGGSLSCLIANAVLHAADKELDRLKRRLRRSFTYLRYCDDMILLARDRHVCEQAFACYCRILKSLRLPAHEPREVGVYPEKFWEGKSNRPYHWTKPQAGVGIPWIQFVGYQVRYDGLVRVRLKSLKKHFKKLTGAADKVLAALNPGRKKRGAITPFAAGIRRNSRQIEHRFRQKLISLAVGRRRLGPPLSEPMPMSWANGFRGLLGKKFVSSCLKALDRHRERQIRRVVRRLRQLPPPQASQAAKSEARNVHRYYGFPFSYWAQFQALSKL